MSIHKNNHLAGLVVFVVGSTATGKSDLAVEIAEKINAEIINADSIQIYKEVEIGTAKPEKELTDRVPHHLLSFVEAPNQFTAGEFVRAVEEIIQIRRDQGVQNFVIVGGSGFYIQALDKGMLDLKSVSSEIKTKLLTRLAAEGLDSLWRELKTFDEASAQKIHPSDQYRILRSLELFHSGQKSMHSSEIQNKKSFLRENFKILKIGVLCQRDFLRARVQRRTQKMLTLPWIEEVQRLRTQGLQTWAPMKSVGYLEMNMYLEQLLKKEELFEKIVTSTMQLAKKQRTWFKRDSEIYWIENHGQSITEMLDQSMQFIEQNLD